MTHFYPGIHRDSGTCSPVATWGWGSDPESISGTWVRQRDWSNDKNGGKTNYDFTTFQRKSRPAYSKASLWQRRIFGTNQRNRLFSSILKSESNIKCYSNNMRYSWYVDFGREKVLFKVLFDIWHSIKIVFWPIIIGIEFSQRKSMA